MVSFTDGILLFIVCFDCLVVDHAAKHPSKGQIGIDIRSRPEINSNSSKAPKCMGDDINSEMMLGAFETCQNQIDQIGGGSTFGTGSRPASIDKNENNGGEKNLCFTACVWKNLGLINKDMTFTQDVSTFVIKTFPASAQAKVMEAMMTCAKNNKWPVSMENNCTSYRPMRNCLMSSVIKICKKEG